MHVRVSKCPQSGEWIVSEESGPKLVNSEIEPLACFRILARCATQDIANLLARALNALMN